MRVKFKLTKGRQKIEMKAIGNEAARQVCFSKRRPSLFKKASELSTLCGAKVAIVVFSPGGKSFSFGHPSVNSLVDRFLSMHTSHGSVTSDEYHGTEEEKCTNNYEMQQQVAELLQSLEAEKQKKENVHRALKKEGSGHLMQCLVAGSEMLGLDVLKELRKDLIAVQRMIDEKTYQMLQDAKQARRPPPQSDIHLDTHVIYGCQRDKSMHTMLPPDSTNESYERFVEANPMLARAKGSFFG